MKNANRVVNIAVTIIVFTLVACRQQLPPSETANPPQVNSNQPTASAATLASATETSFTETPATELDLSLRDQCWQATLSPDGSLLAAGCGPGIVIYDASSLRQIAEIPGNGYGVLDLALSLDNKFITIAYTPDQLVYIVKQVDFNNNVQVSDTEVFSDVDYSDKPDVMLSPDGTTIALYKSGMLKIWDVTNARELHNEKFQIFFRNITFSPDGKTLAFTESDNLISWDVVNGNKRDILVGDPNRLPYDRKTAFSTDGRLLAIATGYDYVLFGKYTLSILEYASGNELISFDVPITPSMSANPLFALSFSKDGSLLATGSATAITIWDTSTGQALQTVDYAVENNDYAGYNLLFVADDTKLISVSEWNIEMIMWDVTTGEQIAP